MLILSFKIMKVFKMTISLFTLAKNLDLINMAMEFKFGQMVHDMKDNGL